MKSAGAEAREVGEVGKKGVCGYEVKHVVVDPGEI